LSNNIFRSSHPNRQYLSAREREKLIRDYLRARDDYRKAVADARRDYEELVRAGLMPGDGKNSK
jgi:hypothetical protein